MEKSDYNTTTATIINRLDNWAILGPLRRFMFNSRGVILIQNSLITGSSIKLLRYPKTLPILIIKGFFAYGFNFPHAEAKCKQNKSAELSK